MSVKIKFTVLSNDLGDTSTIKLSPSYNAEGPNEINSKIFKFTPSGGIELDGVFSSLGEFFEKGKEYFVEFTEVEVKEPPVEVQEPSSPEPKIVAPIIITEPENTQDLGTPGTEPVITPEPEADAPVVAKAKTKSK